MKKIRSIFLSVLLIIVSVAVAFWIMQFIDFVAGYFVPQGHWPGPQGLLFPPNTEYNWDMHDYKMKEVINRLGFRDRADVTVVKRFAYRIVAIGDSFTYGYGVNLEDTWVKRLEHYLRKEGLDVEVLNLGRPGFGPNEYAQVAGKVIPLLKPDLVILGILNGDDPQRCVPDFLHLFMNLRSLVKYWKEADYARGEPKPFQEEGPEEDHRLMVSIAKEILDGMTGAQRDRFEKLEPEVREAFLDGRLNPWLIQHTTREPDYFLKTTDPSQLRRFTWRMGRKFKQIKRIAERHHADVIAFSLPEGFYVNKAAYTNVQRIGFRVTPEMQTTDVPDRCIEAACTKAHIPFCSVLKEFREHADEPGLYLELDRHMAPAGYELFAKTITPIVAKRIQERKHE